MEHDCEAVHCTNEKGPDYPGAKEGNRTRDGLPRVDGMLKVFESHDFHLLASETFGLVSVL